MYFIRTPSGHKLMGSWKDSQYTNNVVQKIPQILKLYDLSDGKSFPLYYQGLTRDTKHVYSNFHDKANEKSLPLVCILITILEDIS
jgi:hypothetical protein